MGITKEGEHLVGQVAKRQAVTNPENTIFSAITKATEQLQRATHVVAELLYKSTEASQAGPSGTGAGHAESGVKEGEVVDAEYAETR